MRPGIENVKIWQEPNIVLAKFLIGKQVKNSADAEALLNTVQVLKDFAVGKQQYQEASDLNEVENHIQLVLDKNCEFYNSWDLIMVTAGKFDCISVENLSLDKVEQYVELCDELDHLVACYKIEPIFFHLVNCITWYNKNFEYETSHLEIAKG